MNTTTEPTNRTETLEQELTSMHKRAREIRAELHQLSLGNSEQAAADKAARAKVDRQEKYRTENGLTIHNLRLAGNSVKVVHIRFADIPGCPLAVPVPSFLRGVYPFTSKGGATHIIIENESKDLYIAVSSVCHDVDSFDYKLGVKRALERISNDVANTLLN